ncbi:MAG: hypothetical protein ACQESR_21955 [Planctomycetota bacterium]
MYGSRIDLVRRESDQREDDVRRAAFHSDKADRLKYPCRMISRWRA